MGSLKAFYTIPELYKFLTEDFGPKKVVTLFSGKSIMFTQELPIPNLKKKPILLRLG